MAQATEKQINYARMLGISEPERHTKEELMKMIDAKKGGDDKQTTVAFAAPVREANHDIIVSRTEKANSFEFGKAGRRHKLYYEDIADLLDMYRALKEAGLIDVEDEIETIKL